MKKRMPGCFFFILLGFALWLVSIVTSTGVPVLSLLSDEAEAQDLLILRNGTVMKGELRLCTGQSCTLGTDSVPRPEIAWIGLARSEIKPPVVRDSRDDEIHLRDQTVQRGRLVGINASQVFTERGSFERRKVAWVYLAAAAGEKPASKTTPAPGTRPGKPLGGSICFRSDFTNFDNCHGTMQIRAWFRLLPNGKPFNGIALSYSAPEISYEISIDGCADYPGRPGESIPQAGNVCEAPPGRITGVVTLDKETLGQVTFFPLMPTLHFLLPLSVAQTPVAKGKCYYTNPGLADLPPRDFEIKAPSDVRIEGSDSCKFDPKSPRNFCVKPTPCAKMSSSDCFVHIERYAVIPFNGSLSETFDKTIRSSQKENWVVRIGASVTWDICEAGTSGCTTEPPPATPGRTPTPDCPEPRNERALPDAAQD